MIMIGNNKKKVLAQIFGDGEEAKEKEGGESTLKLCVHELVEAIHNKDVDGTLSAFRALFAELDAEPEGVLTERY
jgi:hypothetical protein